MVRLVQSTIQQKAQRLIGFDCLKVAAAYGVVVIHGLGETPKTYWANKVSDFFLFFSVPVFLIMAFYFGVSSLYTSDWRNHLFKRFKRLLVPFYAWSILYLIARLLKQVLLQDEALEKLFANPVSLLLGSAGVQLYFLPMLFTGVIAAICITRWIQPNPFWVPLVLLLGSLYLSMPLQVAGGSQDVRQILNIMQSSILAGWFDAWLKMVQPQWFAESAVVIMAWVLYCLPYICISILLLNTKVQLLLSQLANRRSVAIASALLAITLALIVFFHCFSLRFLVPVLALVLAILSSKVLTQEVAWIRQLSYLSFGIYLIHGLLTAGLTPILSRLNFIHSATQLSLLHLLAIATLIFCFSALVTALMARNKRISRILLGI